MRNRMDKKIDNEMGTGLIPGFIGMISKILVQDSLYLHDIEDLK